MSVKRPREETHINSHVGSLNPIVTFTGPRSGVLSTVSQKENLKFFEDSVDDETYKLLSQAWRSIYVPSDLYWSHSSKKLKHLDPLSLLNQKGKGKIFNKTLIPDSNHISESFYASRTDAMAMRGYQTGNGQLVVGVDRQLANGSKIFNVFSRGAALNPEMGNSSISDFITSIRNFHDRNFYILVDENSPVDPFFDIDYTFQQGDSSPANVIEGESVEQLLFSVLDFLKQKLEGSLSVKVEKVLVLTSSVEVITNEFKVETCKISFHIHMRFAENKAFANIKELQRFMGALRSELEGEKEKNVELGKLFSLIDFSVYSRWRAFRLPYNVKCPYGSDFTAVDAAAIDILEEQGEKEGIIIPNCRVGAIASTLVTQIHTSSQNSNRSRLLKKLMHRYRFLLPVVPDVTRLKTKDLSNFLSSHRFFTGSLLSTKESVNQMQDDNDEFIQTVFDLSFIQRENVPTELQLYHHVEGGDSQKEKEKELNPFAARLPPFPHSRRVPIENIETKKILAELFACLAPQYAGVKTNPTVRTLTEFSNIPVQSSTAIKPEGLFVQYEEGIRGYYVMQKQSKYCMRQQREHKSTYVQLYLTYGSIKVRCYSNDCCDRCLFIAWDSSYAEQTNSDPDAFYEGYPKYDRLKEIRLLLFPPLPPNEIIRRYGTEQPET